MRWSGLLGHFPQISKFCETLEASPSCPLQLSSHRPYTRDLGSWEAGLPPPDELGPSCPWVSNVTGSVSPSTHTFLLLHVDGSRTSCRVSLTTHGWLTQSVTKGYTTAIERNLWAKDGLSKTRTQLDMRRVAVTVTLVCWIMKTLKLVEVTSQPTEGRNMQCVPHKSHFMCAAVYSV